MSLYSLLAWKSFRRPNSLQHFVRNYRNLNRKKKYTVMRTAAISITLNTIADIAMQHYECYTGRRKTISFTRTLHMAISGCLVSTTCYYWYYILNTRVPGHTLKSILSKVLIDQIVFSPFYIIGFLLSIGILERSNCEKIVNNIKAKSLKLYIYDWMIWPIGHFIELYWMKGRYRKIYRLMLSIIYDSLLSKVEFENNPKYNHK